MRKTSIMVLLSCLICLIFSFAYADDFAIENTIYNDDHTGVIIQSGGSSQGAIVIPSAIYDPISDQDLPVVGIGGNAFAAREITSVTIPETVQTIGANAFSSCRNLRTITLREGLQSIGSSAFANCSSLTSITIPDSVTEIQYLAFNNCSGMSTLHIGSGLRQINMGAFQRCTALTEVVLPENVSIVGKHAFGGCTSLLRITLPDHLVYEEDSFPAGALMICNASGQTAKAFDTFADPSLTGWKLTWNADKNAVEAVRDTAVSGADPLPMLVHGVLILNGAEQVAFVLPAGLDTIEEEAFSGIAAAAVKVPASCRRIEARAFASSPSLRYVFLPAGVSLHASAFDGCSNLTLVLSAQDDNIQYVAQLKGYGYLVK